MSAQPQAMPRSRKRRGPMLLGIVLGLLLVLAAIRAATVEPRTTKPFLRDAHPVILAHQGASGHAPSNTLEAFELAVKQGADILEVDVHLTSDGVVVVSHDDTIDRLTNGKGRIREMSLTQLRTYDFGHGFTPDEGKTFPYRGKGIAIPTLEEVFQRFPGVRVNIEIKQTHPPVEEKLWD
jgi:glycerophosphoryl diester phosphodiesterase